jgi:ribonucleoside-triphosphate reductase
MTDLQNTVEVTSVNGVPTYHSTVDPPFKTIGLVTFTRTYARRLNGKDPSSTVESWEQCINRVITGARDQLHVGFTQEEEIEVFSLLHGLKFSVAGRFLWQLGTETVDRLGLFSLQNCAYRNISSAIDPFIWAMDALMLGSGVGYSVEEKHINKLPRVQNFTGKIFRSDTSDADFIVPDSREGWVKLLGKTLKAYFYSGKGFSYSCTLLRSKGAPITSFGGLASGPEALCEGIALISTILGKRQGEFIRSVDALDVMNVIGMIVVSGNVRRSAQLCLGDINDKEYLSAKRWDLGNIPNYRCYSNNSVACNNTQELPEEFWEGYRGNGEPYGLVNLDLMRTCGRLGEFQYPDPDVCGSNPCVEISLCDGEVCCLSELYLPNIESKEVLFKCAKYAYRMCKHSLALDCHQKITNDIVHKNYRIGVGITGYLQATEEQRCWLPECYKLLRQYDVEYSEKLGLPVSIKLTTVKPSGTLSLLAGVTPGIHPGFARFYIRRVRFSSDSPLIELCRNNGYKTEPVYKFDGTVDHTTTIVEFPTRLSDETVLADDLSAIDQLEFVKRIQTDWSDNSVSVTVYYRKEELNGIKSWLDSNFTNSLKSVSFLLHSDHGFKQAPMEQITEEAYNLSMVNVKEIVNITTDDYKHTNADEQFIEEQECAGGSCPMK